jgi:PhnB protein
MATPAPAPQYRTITPYLVVGDGEAELRFLKEAFGGIEAGVHRREDGTVQHAEVRIGDSLVMLGQPPSRDATKAAAIYLWVDDVDATYARALAAGATSESAPADMSYGHRGAGVIDANGITWWIGSPVKGR